MISNKRHHGTDANLLSRKWDIGLKKANNTIAKTTQFNGALLPLNRRYRTDLLLQRLRFYMDTAYSKTSDSIRGNSCVQIFTDGDGSIFAYPLKSNRDCGNALQEFCSKVGIPRELHQDNAPEMNCNNTDFMKVCRSNKIISSTTEPHSPWKNICKNMIGVIMKKAKARRVRRRIPNKVWDYQIVWECQIYSCTCHNSKDTG